MGQRDPAAPRPRPRKVDPVAVAEALRLKKALVCAIRAEMAAQDLSILELAERVGTGRWQVKWVLNPEHEAVTLLSLCRVAHALGRRLRVELE